MFPPKARLVPTVLTATGLLWWSLVCGAQMVGPTPQPAGVPVSPEEAAQVELETWAVHAQSTLTAQIPRSSSCSPGRQAVRHIRLARYAQPSGRGTTVGKHAAMVPISLCLVLTTMTACSW
jgi:hypothetical protein